MLHIFDGLRDVSFLSTLFRLVLACLIGAAIGLERSWRNKPAGFRTHILVCLGAAIASLTGVYLYVRMKLPTDMSRIGAQVIAGLGFIGAGTIIVTRKNTIKGLTTAAGLWTAGVIGLAIGAGFYEGGIIACILVLLTETLFNKIRSNIRRAYEFEMALSYVHRHDLDEVLRYFKNNNYTITNLQVSGINQEGRAVYNAVLTLRSSKEKELDELVNEVRNKEGILSAELL